MTSGRCARNQPAEDVQSLIFWGFYRNLLSQIELGHYVEAAQVLERFQTKANRDADLESVRRLIAYRMALKAGQGAELEPLALAKGYSYDWLEAEAAFVNGLLSYHLGRYQEGVKFFQQAETGYLKLDNYDRTAVAAFNVLVGGIYLTEPNAGDIQTLESSLGELDRIYEIAKKSDDPRSQRMMGIVLRQKATFLAQKFDYEQASSCAAWALELVEPFGSKSDVEICLLLRAHFALMQDRVDEAKLFFERVKRPFDDRVAFPHAFVAWRLGGDRPSPNSFRIVTPEWQNWFNMQSNSENIREEKRVLCWDESKRNLTLRDGSVTQLIPLKANSKEGRLIQILSERKASRALLLQMLWPEQQDPFSTENRLHQLLHRLNKKLKDLIVFDGAMYSLNAVAYQFERQ